MGKKSKEKTATELLLDAAKRVAALREIADRLEAEISVFDDSAVKQAGGEPQNLTLHGKGDSPQLIVAMLVERIRREDAAANRAPVEYDISLRYFDGEWSAKARWVR